MGKDKDLSEFDEGQIAMARGVVGCSQFGRKEQG